MAEQLRHCYHKECRTRDNTNNPFQSEMSFLQIFSKLTHFACLETFVLQMAKWPHVFGAKRFERTRFSPTFCEPNHCAVELSFLQLEQVGDSNDIRMALHCNSY